MMHHPHSGKFLFILNSCMKKKPYSIDCLHGEWLISLTIYHIANVLTCIHTCISEKIDSFVFFFSCWMMWLLPRWLSCYCSAGISSVCACLHAYCKKIRDKQTDRTWSLLLISFPFIPEGKEKLRPKSRPFKDKTLLKNNDLSPSLFFFAYSRITMYGFK